MEGSTDEVHGYHYSSYSNEHVEEDDVRHNKIIFRFHWFELFRSAKAKSLCSLFRWWRFFAVLFPVDPRGGFPVRFVAHFYCGDPPVPPLLPFHYQLHGDYWRRFCSKSNNMTTFGHVNLLSCFMCRPRIQTNCSTSWQMIGLFESFTHQISKSLFKKKL